MFIIGRNRLTYLAHKARHELPLLCQSHLAFLKLSPLSGRLLEQRQIDYGHRLGYAETRAHDVITNPGAEFSDARIEIVSSIKGRDAS